MADYEVIPQDAIDKLVSNPTVAPAFNSVFGTGRAEEILAAQAPKPEPVVEQEDDDWSFAGEAYRAVVGGVRDAAHETANFAQWVDVAVNDAIFGEGRVLTLGGVIDREDSQFLFGDGGKIETPDVAENKTLVGNFGRGVTQFTAGYVTAGSLTRMTGLKGAFINGAIADAVVFNPDDKNVSAMLNEYGYDVPVVTELLATDPDDPEYINRLRNASEGVVIGGIVEAIGWGIRAKRAAAAGDPVKAKEATEAQRVALKDLEKATKEAGIEVARDVQQSVDLSKTIFDEKDFVPPKTDADGQLALDLGDTPLPAQTSTSIPKVSNRLFVTPEKAENIRYQASLAQGVDNVTKLNRTSFKSLTTVSSFDEVADDIAANVAVYADEFTKIKGGDVQRWSTVKAQAAAKLRQMAEMTGETPEALIARFRSANDGDMTKLAAEIHAQSRYVLTVEQELQKMAKVINAANSGAPFDLKAFPGIENIDHLKLAFNQRREVATNLLAGLDASRSNIARAMNAMKIAKEGDDRLREMLKDPDAFKDVDAAARAVADPSNAGKPAVRVIDEAIKKLHGFMDGVNTFRINALLSGPGTQEVNLISNAINSFVIPAEQFMGGLASADRRIMAHALRQLQGRTAGMIDSVQTALTVAYRNESILDNMNKIEEAEFAQATTLTGKIIRLPSRGLMSMDEYFKQSQYRGVVFADAHAEAARMSLKGEEKSRFIRQYLKESYTDTGAALRGDALLQARRATFTEPLDPGLASMIQKAAIDHPTVRFFVPFVRTPVNILSQTYQHFPIIGTTSKRFRADLQAGGARAAQAKGKQIVGTALVGMAGFMAANGMITGAGPSDPRIRKVWLKNNQPYSFRFVNEDGTVEFISFARLEPLSNVFSIAADAVEIMNDEYNEAEAVPVIQALTISVMENTVNKTFTQGIADAMKLFVGRPHEQQMAARNFVASFVPNVLNQTNGDEALREVRSMTDAILSRTHEFGQVDPKRNVLGEVTVRRLPKYDPLGLTQADRREVDEVMEEITRAAILNQSVADSPSRKVRGLEDIDLAEVPYKDNQSVYDRWLELTGTLKINGRTLRQELEKMINSRSYRIAPEGDTTGTKGAMIRKIITSYRKAAKGQLPELQEIEKAQKMGLGQDKKKQVQRNRELFPVNTGNAPVRLKRRTFEDLLNQ